MIDAIKRLILADLPSLDPMLKAILSIIIVLVAGFFVIAMWRDPIRASQLDPQIEKKLEISVKSFFEQGDFGPSKAPIIFGKAKDIVRRFKGEKDVFTKVENEIEKMKKNDNNWTFANDLTAAKALVNALGLDTDTEADNRIFLQMPFPTLAN
jgi:Sec-independent protein translocase protein TatA